MNERVHGCSWVNAVYTECMTVYIVNIVQIYWIYYCYYYDYAVWVSKWKYCVRRVTWKENIVIIAIAAFFSNWLIVWELISELSV